MTGSGEMNLDHIKVVACPGVAFTAVVNLAEESWVGLIHGRRTSEGGQSQPWIWFVGKFGRYGEVRGLKRVSWVTHDSGNLTHWDCCSHGLMPPGPS